MYQPNDFPPAHNQGVGAPPNSTGQKALLGQKTKEVAKNVGKVLTTHNDQDLQVWNLLTEFPILSGIWNIVVLVLNIFLPGTGTMVVAFLGKQCSKTHMMVGLVQLLTTTWIIGWIWSIYWGFLIFMNQPRQDNVNAAPPTSQPYNPNAQYDMASVDQPPHDQYNYGYN